MAMVVGETHPECSKPALLSVCRFEDTDVWSRINKGWYDVLFSADETEGQKVINRFGLVGE